MQKNKYSLPLEENEVIKIALIATYPEMSHNLAELVQGTGIEVLDIYASFNDAVNEAIRLEHKVDAILTRGGTGHLVKSVVSIPVVSVPILPYDLAMTISSLPEKYKKIAFVNYKRELLEIQWLEKAFNKEIRQYQFVNQIDLRKAVTDAKEDGCDIYIGGAEGCSYADSLGFENQEIVSGKETLFQSLSEAIEIVHAKREEKKRTARLKAAFDSLTEGICVIDEKGITQIYNPSLSKMFHSNPEQMIGHNILEIEAGSYNKAAFETKTEYLNIIEQIQTITASTNHHPIHLDGKFIGVVSTYEDITKIQMLEGQIRKQLSQRNFLAKYTFDDILTANASMQSIKEIANLYAQTDSAVLIEGESGTGKELFAHSIHNASARASGPFVAINCAAIPENLLESELFGYAPGAFTGANKAGKKGLFEMANNGTIFLDEIGEMPKYLQSRLLRVLQEKEIMRVGDSKIISVNCRIISATNKDLKDLSSKNEFREDLYYRLSIFSITIPPLRERKEDIPILGRHFLTQAGINVNLPSLSTILEKEFETMKKQEWKGNIREFSNACARLALLYSVEHRERIENYIRNSINVSKSGKEKIVLRISDGQELREAMSEAEEQYILSVLDKNNNNQSAAAKALGIGRTTLWRKIHKDEEIQS